MNKGVEMALSTEQAMLVEQRLANEKKTAGIAYVLWFFFGGLGVHRFYLGKAGSGAAILILLILGVFTSAIGIGLALLVAVGIWLLVDLFLIPGLVTSANDAKRQMIAGQVAGQIAGQ